MMNILIMQRHGYYANIQMNVSAIANVATMKRHSCYSGILIGTSAMLNALIAQRCKRCTFNSPGLTSESEVYPGSFAVRGNNAVGVVPFIPRHFIAAFHAENVQHLRRCMMGVFIIMDISIEILAYFAIYLSACWH